MQKTPAQQLTLVSFLSIINLGSDQPEERGIGLFGTRTFVLPCLRDDDKGQHPRPM
jgi:hypothetical protein